MKSNRTFSNLLASLAIAVVSLNSHQAAAADEQFLTGLELAILHFNADGSKELKSWGPEHTYMMKVLESVQKEFPQLKDASKAGTYRADMRYKSLAFSNTEQDVEIATVDQVKALSEALVKGCGYRRETRITEQDLGFTKPSKETKVETSYELSSRGSRKCVSPSAKTLADMGLDRLVITTDQRRRYDTFTVSLEVGVNTWQDMRFIKSKLEATSGLDRDLLRFLQPPAAPRMIGVSSDIQLLGSTGKADFDDAFTLVYYQGSGDCPAGCINKIYTTVKVEPKKGTDPMNPTFQVTLVDVK